MSFCEHGKEHAGSILDQMNLLSTSQAKPYIMELLVLPYLQALETNLSHFVMKSPANILQARVIQKVLVEFLHPHPNLSHAYCSDLWQRIPVITDEHQHLHNFT
jgi:hypothetical protein